MSDAIAVRELMESVLATTPDFGAVFYRTLFARHPELAPLFHRSSADAQQKMFTQKLMMLVDMLEEPQRLRHELVSIAATHASYGVTAPMYAQVGAALVDSIAACLPEGLAPHERAALERSWAMMSEIILQG